MLDVPDEARRPRVAEDVRKVIIERRALVGLGVGAVPLLEHDHVGNGDVEGKARDEVAVHGLGVDDEDADRGRAVRLQD